MTPGITGVGGNRPKPMPLVRLFSFLVEKREVTPLVHYDGETFAVSAAAAPIGSPPPPDAPEAPPAPPAPPARPDGSMVEVPLVALATLDVPAYPADALPPELAALPVEDPGSRRLGK